MNTQLTTQYRKTRAQHPDSSARVVCDVLRSQIATLRESHRIAVRMIAAG